MEQGQTKRILTFLIEGFVGLILILAPIRWADQRGLFDNGSDENSVERWASLRQYQDRIPVDVLILGNSHAYTGLSPEWLSAATGMTCFVLGFRGTDVTDHYWVLREALLHVKPQLVLVETTGIGFREEADNLFIERMSLVNQLLAFHARQDELLKAESLPELFELEDFLTAWSPTVMNHHLWWTEPEKVRENIYRAEPYNPTFKRCYFGGYSRFSSGVEDTTLVAYRELGGVLRGGEQYVSEAHANEVRRVVDLGREVGFNVGFFTLPMHEEFLVESEARSAFLREVFEPLGAPWINFQDSTRWLSNPDLFENTLTRNQHLTVEGALTVNQPLASWVLDTFEGLDQPGLRGDSSWHATFMDRKGYHAYFPAQTNSPSVKHVARDVKLQNKALDQVVFHQDYRTSERFMDVTTRIPQSWLTKLDPRELVVVLPIVIQTGEGQERSGKLNLRLNDHVNDGKHWVFQSRMNAGEILRVGAASLARK